MKNSSSNKKLIVVVGPTASGKTTTAIALARYYRTDIISADSRQFYKELKIGTATPTEEELLAARHYFIGHLSMHDYYNAFHFEKDAFQKIGELFVEKDVVIMAGGSGLYIDAVTNGIDDLPDPKPGLREELKDIFKNKGLPVLQEMLLKYDPEYYQLVDLNNPKRILRALEVSITSGQPYSSLRILSEKNRPFDTLFIGLFCERTALNERIHLRVDQMLKDGLLNEIEDFFPYRHLNSLNTVGYKELFRWKEGEISFEQGVENIKTNTRRYAKRQMTWFRKNDKIVWFPFDQTAGIIRYCHKEIR